MKAAKRAWALLVTLAALALAGQVLGAEGPFKGGDSGHFAVAGKACGPHRSWARVDIRGTGQATASASTPTRRSSASTGS
jgi:hypothetical protein